MEVISDKNFSNLEKKVSDTLDTLETTKYGRIFKRAALGLGSVATAIVTAGMIKIFNDASIYTSSAAMLATLLPLGSAALSVGLMRETFSQPSNDGGQLNVDQQPS